MCVCVCSDWTGESVFERSRTGNVRDEIFTRLYRHVVHSSSRIVLQAIATGAFRHQDFNGQWRHSRVKQTRYSQSWSFVHCSKRRRRFLCGRFCRHCCQVTIITCPLFSIPHFTCPQFADFRWFRKTWKFKFRKFKQWNFTIRKNAILDFWNSMGPKKIMNN